MTKNAEKTAAVVIGKIRYGASESRCGVIPRCSSLSEKNCNCVLIPRWPSGSDGGERREDRRGGRGKALDECERQREDRNGGHREARDWRDI